MNNIITVTFILSYVVDDWLGCYLLWRNLASFLEWYQT